MNTVYVEKLVEFVVCDGREISSGIVDSLRNLNLQSKNVVLKPMTEQGIFLGKQKVCATWFQQLSPKALYYLNLALSHASPVHVYLPFIV